MSDVWTVRADGLKDLARDLKAADASWPKHLRVGFNDALQPVVSAIKSALGGGKRASTIKAASTGSGRARIRAGGPKSAAPYTGWYEFGGSVTRHKVFGKPTKFFVWRTIPKTRDGKIIYPTATRRDDALAARLADVVDKVVAEAGFK